MRVQIYQNIKKSLTAYGKICKINLQFMENKSGLWHISFEKKSVVKNSRSKMIYFHGGGGINTKDIGDLGESFATEFLEKSGYCIVARNYRIKSGEEIDIIAIKNGRWRLIEVKTRTSLNFGYPCESVDKTKLRRMNKCFIKFLNERGLESEDYKIEIFEVLINHITN